MFCIICYVAMHRFPYICQQDTQGTHSYIQIDRIPSSSQYPAKHTLAPMRIVVAATERADADAYLRNTKCYGPSISAWQRVD